jgi:hypothetical protein
VVDRAVETQAGLACFGPRGVRVTVDEVTLRAAQRELDATGVGEESMGEVVHGCFPLSSTP